MALTAHVSEQMALGRGSHAVCQMHCHWSRTAQHRGAACTDARMRASSAMPCR